MSCLRTTEHISNEEVKSYYNKILEKISLEIKRKYNSGEYRYLNKECMEIAIMMFEKYKMQFYSAIFLAHHFTEDILYKKRYFDISSVEAIIRACYEIFLTFDYIYIQTKFIWDEEKINISEENYSDMIQLKILLYKYESYKQCISAFSTIPDAKEDVKKSYKDIEEKIKKNKMFKCLDGKDELLKQWRPSWNCIAKRTILSEWNSKNMYNIISQYSHNSYVRLVSACRDAQNVEECDRDAIFMQLFEFTAIFINDYIKLLEIDYNKILEEDEIALLQEFLCFAEKNPSDVQ